MNDDACDNIDAAWDQHEQEERRRIEEEWLTQDIGYTEFLQSIMNSYRNGDFTYGIRKHQEQR